MGLLVVEAHQLNPGRICLALVKLLGKKQCTIITGLDKKKFKHKIVNIFLPISFNICFGCSKEPFSMRRFF